MTKREITIEKKIWRLKTNILGFKKNWSQMWFRGGAVVVSRLEHKLLEEPITFDAEFRILPWKCCVQFMFSVWDHFTMIGN